MPSVRDALNLTGAVYLKTTASSCHCLFQWLYLFWGDHKQFPKRCNVGALGTQSVRLCIMSWNLDIVIIFLSPLPLFLSLHSYTLVSLEETITIMKFFMRMANDLYVLVQILTKIFIDTSFVWNTFIEVDVWIYWSQMGSCWEIY